IAVRAAAGASSPAAILIPSIIATCLSTTAAIIAAKLLAKRNPLPPLKDTSTQSEQMQTANLQTENLVSVSKVNKFFTLIIIPVLLGAIPYHIFKMGHMPEFNLDLITSATSWLVPLIMGTLLVFGYLRGVKVYETVTEGAKEGFDVAIRIIPFMVAIFVAIGMFRASGALEIFTTLVSPLTNLIGMPPETLPVALLRPLSGTGAFGAMSELVNHAPDSFASFVASVMQGSTETTFYVLAVYFGAIGIKKSRHALPAALIADAVGLISAVLVSRVMF
ncbi:MAG: spore maturation protein, partial [Fibrobacter sp.]|nr:spore maturation protein [Fibrobacter sp.]